MRPPPARASCRAAPSDRRRPAAIRRAVAPNRTSASPSTPHARRSTFGHRGSVEVGASGTRAVQIGRPRIGLCRPRHVDGELRQRFGGQVGGPAHRPGGVAPPWPSTSAAAPGGRYAAPTCAAPRPPPSNTRRPPAASASLLRPVSCPTSFLPPPPSVPIPAAVQHLPPPVRAPSAVPCRLPPLAIRHPSALPTAPSAPPFWAFPLPPSSYSWHRALNPTPVRPPRLPLPLVAPPPSPPFCTPTPVPVRGPPASQLRTGRNMSGGGDNVYSRYAQPENNFSSSYNPAPPPFSPPRMDNTRSLGPYGFDLNTTYASSTSASAHGGMAGPSHGCAGYGAPMSASTPQGGMAGASHGYSGYGVPLGFQQMSYHAGGMQMPPPGGMQMPQPPRHSTSSISGFARGPFAPLPPNQVPPMLPNYGTYGDGGSHGGPVHMSHASPSWHPSTMRDEEMSSAAPRRRRGPRTQVMQQAGFLDAEVGSSEHSMPSVGEANNITSGNFRAKWDDKLTEILCRCWLDQDHAGYSNNGKLTPIGWSKLVPAFQAATGLPFQKVQLESHVRQIRKVYTALKLLKSGSGNGRTSGGGYVASEITWSRIKTLGSEAERLRFASPPWHELLDEMFKDAHFDIQAVMKASGKEPTTENVASEETPAGDSIPTGTTSGSRKRGRSGATKSTADSPSKPPVKSTSPASGYNPKARRSIWGRIVDKIKGQAQASTGNIVQITSDLLQRKDAAMQKYERCLQLAKEAGITTGSDEFIFFSEHLEKNNERQSSFLMCDTHEDRRDWITKAFRKYQMAENQMFDVYMRQMQHRQQQQGNEGHHDSY